MLRHERTLERIQRANLAGGLLPSATLLEDLIKFLNQPRTGQGMRVGRILEQMLGIEEMTKSIKGIVLPAMSLKRTNPAKFKLLCEIDDEVALLQRELAKFKSVPRAVVAVGGNGGASEWATWWGHPSETRGRGLRIRPSEAVEAIVRLTQIGCLTRLKRCANCRKWLYAKFRHQAFCSVTCQQKNYTQSERWKAHRRQYMRNYYQSTYRRPEKAKSRT
jgi:hypothetical protein